MEAGAVSQMHESGGVSLQALWRWWTGELRAMLPHRLRARWQVDKMRPVVRLRAASWVIEKPVVRSGELGFDQLAELPRQAGAKGASDKSTSLLASELRSALGRRAPFVLTLPKGVGLYRTIALPLAIEENLRQAIEFEFDRLTPFRPDQVYFDAVVLDRDVANRRCTVGLGYAMRDPVDDAIRTLSAAGGRVAAVVPEGCEATGLNLLPGAQYKGGPHRVVLLALPWLLLLALVATAIAVPVWQKRELANALESELDLARRQALGAESLRKQVEDLEAQYNFVLARKFAYPSTVQVIEELTRLFPDDTWLAQLDIRASGRGKEIQKELQMRGDTANAGRLISVLESSSLITDAAPRSPTLKLQPGPGEAFDLGAKVRPLAQPPLIRIPQAPGAPAGAAVPVVGGSAAAQAGDGESRSAPAAADGGARSPQLAASEQDRPGPAGRDAAHAAAASGSRVAPPTQPTAGPEAASAAARAEPNTGAKSR